jgi:hypothetical protein
MSVGKKMKKIALVLSLFLTACVFGANDKTENDKVEFKNPIFNQPLRPYSRMTNYVYLTPTSIDFREHENENSSYRKGKCDLVENKQSRITLKCNTQWEGGYKDNFYLTFVITNEIFAGCLYVRAYDYDRPEDFPQSSNAILYYCVTPPKDMLLEKNTQLKSD